MTSFFKVFLILFFLMFLTSPGFAQDRVSLQDLVGIPVIEGLSEDIDARIVFDKAEGRIIHALLAGSRSRADVETFYRETLFQLGWSEAITETGNLVFMRDDERLTLSINDGDPLQVEIDLAPIS